MPADAAGGEEPVGIARVLADGTLELDMFSPHVRLTYPPNDPQYAEIRRHVEQRGGPMVLGEERTISPFPAAK